MALLQIGIILLLHISSYQYSFFFKKKGQGPFGFSAAPRDSSIRSFFLIPLATMIQPFKYQSYTWLSSCPSSKVEQLRIHVWSWLMVTPSLSRKFFNLSQVKTLNLHPSNFWTNIRDHKMVNFSGVTRTIYSPYFFLF